MTENYKLIEDLARKDAAMLVHKGKTYGDSWKKRGGVGAMMMLARKWDRIENIVKEDGWDIFKACANDNGEILDDIQDLRCYLLLVQAHVESELLAKLPTAPAMPRPCPPGTTPPPPLNMCHVCGALGAHAGMPCPRAMPTAQYATNHEDDTCNLCPGCRKAKCECLVSPEPGPGYVDQDGHDPYSRK